MWYFITFIAGAFITAFCYRYFVVIDLEGDLEYADRIDEINEKLIKNYRDWINAYETHLIALGANVTITNFAEMDRKAKESVKD